MITINIDINQYNYLLKNKDEILHFIINDFQFYNLFLVDKKFKSLKWNNFENNNQGDSYLIYNFSYLNINTISSETLFLIHDKNQILLFDIDYLNIINRILFNIKNKIRIKKIKAVV